jgi:hypothetical protein
MNMGRRGDPLNVTSTSIVSKTLSAVTVAKPVPGEAFGGDSEGPLRIASKVTDIAVTEVCNIAAAL